MWRRLLAGQKCLVLGLDLPDALASLSPHLDLDFARWLLLAAEPAFVKAALRAANNPTPDRND